MNAALTLSYRHSYSEMHHDDAKVPAGEVVSKKKKTLEQIEGENCKHVVVPKIKTFLNVGGI